MEIVAIQTKFIGVAGKYWILRKSVNTDLICVLVNYVSPILLKHPDVAVNNGVRIC